MLATGLQCFCLRQDSSMDGVRVMNLFSCGVLLEIEESLNQD
jgi:hypothetical protein